MRSILILGNQDTINELYSFYLSPRFKCIRKTSEMEALSFLQSEQADLVLLPMSEPSIDGRLICEKIRKFSFIPIMMVSNNGEKAELVKALKYGADDCIYPPFHEGELLARIEAVLRRSSNSFHNEIHLDGLV